MQEPAEAPHPIVIDLGTRKRKKIKQLKRGQGPLMADVNATMAELVRQMGTAAGSKDFVPVVVVFERKPKKRATMPFFPFKML